jgi:Flp pilus assembly pilin Flp
LTANLGALMMRIPSEIDRRIQIASSGGCMVKALRKLWSDEAGQDIAEYAVMLAVILVIVVGTLRLIGSNANNAFSTVASSIQ